MAYTRLMNGIYVTGDYLEYGDVFDSEGHIKSSILTVDAEIDATSTNPIQNQAVAASIGQATSAATSASASAASAAASATAIATDVADLKEAIEALPDSQAVAVTVAEHTVALAALEPLPEEVEDLKEIVEPLEDVPEILADLSAQKANIDGHYDSLTSGMAENLVGKGNPVTNQSFISRVAGGANAIEDGVASYAKIKGNAVKWNQLFDASQFDDSYTQLGITFAKEGNVLHISGTSTALYPQTIRKKYAETIKGHKYLFAQKFNGDCNTGFSILTVGDTQINYGTSDKVFDSTDNSDVFLLVVACVESGVTLDYKVQYALYDLTAMGCEGVSTYAELMARVPYGINPTDYDGGSLLPNRAKYVCTSKEDGTDVHKLLVDFTAVKYKNWNLFDGEWSHGYWDNGELHTDSTHYVASAHKIPVPANTKLYYKNSLNQDTHLKFYDAQGNETGGYIGPNYYFTTPADAVSMVFYYLGSNEYPTDGICFNIYDVNFNGQYVPYGQALPIFPDGGLAAGAIYDEQSKSGAVKRVGKAILKNLVWVYNSTNNAFYAAVPNKKYELLNIVSNAYTTRTATSGTWNLQDGEIGGAANYYGIYIKDTRYTDAAAFKAHFTDDDVAYYELATPTEISYADTPQDWGTERQIDIQVFAGGREWMESDGNSAPIVADIKYGIDYPTSVEQNRDNIGTMANLTTTAKTSLVAAINELVARVAALEAAAVSTTSLTDEINE